MATKDEPLKPVSTGGFRTVKRKGDHYEVHFKSFAPGLMVMVAFGLTKQQADELKEELNTNLNTYLSTLQRKN